MTIQRKAVTGRTRTLVISLQKAILFLCKYWTVFSLMLIVSFLALAFLAPAFMSSGQIDAAQAIYRFLAPHDHQLPQRSYFLFGENGGIHSYSLPQLVTWGADPNNLRAFVGNAAIGYKTGLNHRMTAIFTAMAFGSFGWLVAGHRPQLRLIPFLVMALPLIIDGLSQMNSDLSDGFRQANLWAISLTGGIFPDSFYAGTTIGTLNWLLRTLTGAIFGLGLSWFLFSYLDYRFRLIRLELEPKLQQIGSIQPKMRQPQS